MSKPASETFKESTIEFQRQLIRDHLAKCDKKARAGFDRIFPEGVGGLDPEKLLSVYSLVDRSLPKEAKP